ncbi:MAG: hypothetical protein ABL993_10700 [Vicinamibacterales bacterium]
MPTCPRDAMWLSEYDANYYSQKGTKSLPVLRIRYADPEQTWLYLDHPARRHRGENGAWKQEVKAR